MDKKAIIGFVLIMAVLLSWTYIWNFFVPPKPQPANAPLTGDTTFVKSLANLDTTHARPESLGAALPTALSAPDSAALAAAAQEPEKLIAIDTKNIRVVLSSIGGTVRQVVLKHYLNFNGEQVQLLGEQSNPEWARYGALTIGYNDRVAIFNSNSFKVEGDSTILNPQNTSTTVTFTYAAPNGATVTKKYTFHYDDYLFDLAVDIKDPAKLNLAQGVTLGWYSPLEPSEYDLSQDRGKLGGFFNMGGEFDYFKKLQGDTLKQIVTGPIDWIATRTKYFAAIVMADSEPGREVVVLGGRVAHISPKGGTTPWELFGVGMTFDNPPADAHYTFNVYTGPLDYDRLNKMNKGLSSLVDLGWKYFRPFAIAILWFFTNMHKFIPNYGFVIIVFSIIMKVIFWPLSFKSAKSMYKMKEIQPKLQEIKEKYKNDPAKLNTETMKAYKEFGVNPFGSCLPMLIQLPIFWALYSVLSNTIELRGANFIFWITDLSQADPSGKLIPLGIGILPIIMGVAMFFQQKMTITDPKQKMMVYLMPILFTYLFSKWASGLVLYWTVFSVIGIVEQWLVQRHIKAEQEAKGIT